MFTLSEEKLASLGAVVTTREIKQQPELWSEAYTNYQDKLEEITSFMDGLAKKHERVRVIFTGAGTSAYVGETITPFLKGKINENQWELQSIPTTTLVSNPTQFFKKEFPTLLVSFARSGNSPESIAAVELGEKLVTDFYQLTITCAPNGKLAQRSVGDTNNLLLLMPARANDQGFAMTGSYTCMTLTALLVFDPAAAEEKSGYVQLLCEMGEAVVKREAEIKQLVESDFERIIYLGSGSLEAAAKEAQLKILELTAGKIVTAYESPLGFRHGPKSFVNEKAVVFVFVSNDPYTRKYDLDMLKELQHDSIANMICAIEVDGERTHDGLKISFGKECSLLPDAYLALPYVMIGQTISLLAAVKVNNTPDTPSPTKTVNRVVQGVTIYEYEANER